MDQGKTSEVTDADFEVMKKDLTVNGTVSMNFLRLIFSHFGFNSHHYELLLNLMFKFDLAYLKCKDADTHRHITHLIQNPISRGRSEDYSQLKKKHELPALSDGQEKLRDEVYQHLEMYYSACVSQSLSDQPLLSALESSGSSLLLPWFLPDSISSDLTMLPPSSTCSQVVSTYAFRHSGPLGLFHRLSARSSRHSVYIRH